MSGFGRLRRRRDTATRTSPSARAVARRRRLGRFRVRFVIQCVIFAGLFGAFISGGLGTLEGSSPASALADPVLAVAGDIACDVGSAPTATACQQKATSDILAGLGADAVLPLGDEQYNSPTLSIFNQMYEPNWGRVKSLSRPIPGNHEYQVPNADGYYKYFGAAAGDPTKGYGSWDMGAWHMIALNGECSSAPQAGCAAGSPQEKWLRADLAANQGKCTLAYWHEPRFSSGNGGSNSLYQPFWQALYEAKADVILAGHSHSYERFDPQSPTGVADPAGPRQFVVGTGGVNLKGFTAVLPNQVVRQNSTFGVMKLALHGSSYDWKFLPIAGKTWTDAGTATCHAAKSVAPTVPTGLAVSGTPTTSQVGLSWSASTDPGGPGVAGYRVYRNGSTTPLNATPVSSTNYTDTTVAPATTYSYTVSAVDTAGVESGKSTAVSATTAAAPTTGPKITLVDKTSTGNSAAVTAVTVGKPAGVVDGDLLISQITADNNPTVTPPAGWSPVVGPLSIGTSARVFTYYHVVSNAAAESSDYTWTLNSAQKWNAGITAFRGVNTTTPFDTAATTKVDSSATVATLAVPGVTTVTAGAVVVGGVGANSGASTVEPPAGWAESMEATTIQIAESAYQQRPTAGATGTATWTFSKPVASAGWVRALRPA
jgi:hypothetical protein